MATARPLRRGAEAGAVPAAVAVAGGGAARGSRRPALAAEAAPAPEAGDAGAARGAEAVTTPG